ncbi:hypothetical protein M8818_000218 [Zalaria obscura]|uniref:Uncharacterized protein n=1 Tax=Zalaria obscura TaxID=2024903 RepID=A0ACC3SP05_9PEZI
MSTVTPAVAADADAVGQPEQTTSASTLLSTVPRRAYAATAAATVAAAAAEASQYEDEEEVEDVDAKEEGDKTDDDDDDAEDADDEEDDEDDDDEEEDNGESGSNAAPNNLVPNTSASTMAASLQEARVYTLAYHNHMPGVFSSNLPLVHDPRPNNRMPLYVRYTVRALRQAMHRYLPAAPLRGRPGCNVFRPWLHSYQGHIRRILTIQGHNVDLRVYTAGEMGFTPEMWQRIGGDREFQGSTPRRVQRTSSSTPATGTTRTPSRILMDMSRQRDRTTGNLPMTAPVPSAGPNSSRSNAASHALQGSGRGREVRRLLEAARPSAGDRENNHRP